MRLEIKALAQERLECALPERALEARLQASRLGALGRKVCELRDYGLNGAELIKHIITVDHFADVSTNLESECISTLLLCRRAC